MTFKTVSGEGLGNEPSSIEIDGLTFTRYGPPLAMARLTKAGSHSTPGIGIVVGTGAKPCSNTGGTYEPPCEAASGMPASRADR